jgi:hypothetical protein
MCQLREWLLHHRQKGFQLRTPDFLEAGLTDTITALEQRNDVVRPSC